MIEPSAGLDRGLLAILCEAYNVEKVGENERIVMKFKKHLAPVKVAVIPLAKNNEKIVAKCHEIKEMLQKLGIGRMDYFVKFIMMIFLQYLFNNFYIFSIFPKLVHKI